MNHHSKELAIKSPLFALWILLVLSTFCWSPSLSQTYSFKHYSSADGLELSSVSTVFQDSRGSLWFGGIGGAFRYDGDRFIPYLTEGKERSVVTKFGEGEDGTIWAATEGNGIAKIRYGDNNSLEWMTSGGKVLPSDSVYSLLSDPEGDMWIGTRAGALVLWGDGSSSYIKKTSGLYTDWVRGIGRDQSGAVWIATTGGITRLTVREHKIILREKLYQAYVIALTVRKDGTVVFGTNEGTDKENKGIFAYKNNILKRIIGYDDISEPLKPQTIYEDSKGVLWIGTTRGCVLQSGNTITRIRTAQGLSNESIGGVLEDREGSVWLATGNGAMKLPRRYALNYTELQGLVGTILLTVLADKSNNIWFGGYSPLQEIGADGRIKPLHNQQLLGSRAVYSLAEDTKGNVWIGTGDGLLVYDGSKFSQQTLGPNPSTRFVHSIAKGQNEGVWVGLRGEILNIRRTEIVCSYNQHNGVADADIVGLMVDDRGRLWFAADGEGGGIIENGAVTRFGSKNGLPSDDVESITEDTMGRIWIITAGGVAYWKDGKFYRLTSSQFPYQHLRVTSIHQDGNGHLWFGTWFGVIEWSDSVLAHYDTRDGLAADFVNAIAEDSSGNLWLGTGGGLTELPKKARISSIPLPALSINRISDEGEMKVLTGQTRLSYDERTVIFQVSSMSYFDERNMEFQYMLHGIEQSWNPPTKQRIARYTTLPPGSYTLRVRGRNRNGAWTEAGAYPFEILPPYWATWWFRFSVVSAIAAFLFALYRYRVSKLLELERLRLRIATDLHDEIGSYLGSIALESEIMQRKLQVSEEVKQRLGKIAALSRRTAEAMRDIVWVINPEHDSMETLEVKIKEVAAQMLKGIPHSIVVSSDTPTEILDLDFKRNLYLVYKEVLHNILKHSHATQVDIVVEQKKKQMMLKIADNGVGFNEQAVTHGNGLKNIRTRAAKMGAHLSLSSAAGSGTTIELSSNIP